MRSRIWVVLLLLMVILAPKVAYAEERESRIESVEIEQYETNELRAAPATPLTLIQRFFTQVRFVFGGGNQNYSLAKLHRHVINFFSGNNTQKVTVIPALVLVFLWWGVRKVIRMLFRAFRKGKANV